MRDYADKANLHARIYAMRSRLLSFKDFASLAENQREALHDQSKNTADPVAEEEIVFREQISGIFPLIEANRTYAPLFLAFLRQFEVFNAKLILAKAFGLEGLEQWYDIGSHATVKRSLLSKMITLQDIRPSFTDTYLADVFEDISSYEQMEIRVDFCAARNLYAASKSFARGERQDFQQLIERRVAVTSTILSLRLRKTYQWDDEKIGSFLDRFHDAFDGKPRVQMGIFEDALYGHLEQLRSGCTQEPSVFDIEHYLERYYYNWISSMFHRDFHSIYCVAAYLWLLFYQIRNLFKIIEGRRFGFSPERIINEIVCNR